MVLKWNQYKLFTCISFDSQCSSNNNSLDPTFNFILRGTQAVLIEANIQSVPNSGIGASLLEIRKGMTDPSAIGGKGVNGFAGQIIFM